VSIKLINKKVQRKLGYYSLRVTRNLIRVLPEPLFRILKSILILIGKPFLAKKKPLVLENLKKVFKDTKSEKEIKQIAQHCFDNTIADMIELIYYIDRPDKILNDVTIEGLEYLEDSIRAGNGAIMMSAHFGNFVLMLTRMVIAGYETNCITKRTRDAQFERYITKLRDHRGFKAIYALPRKRCIIESIKALRRNNLLFILFDQNFGSDGQVFVDFLGLKAATATGPVVLAQRTGAPIHPIFIISEGKQKFKIKILKPVAMKFEDGGRRELINHVAKLTGIIEDFVLKYPSQWGGWFHKRWKTKPDSSRVYEELL